ncbi:hypothetical protein D3C87_1611310 [compost metagenome]
MPNAFGLSATTFTAEVNSVTAKAFPEKAVFFTWNFPPSNCGNSTAPSTNPASSFTAIRGANPFPENELDKTTTSAFSFLAASAITAA